MYKFAGDWTSEVPQTHSQREIYAAKGLGITFLVLCGLWLCMLVFLRRRINLAIGLVKEAARAVIAMPFMMVYPFLQAAGAWRSMHTSYVVWTGTKIRRSIHACAHTQANQPNNNPDNDQPPKQASWPSSSPGASSASTSPPWATSSRGSSQVFQSAFIWTHISNVPSKEQHINN